jgi:F-type H+-transporting ATPase subunit b
MMDIAASNGIDLFIPKIYDIIWSLVVLVVLAVFFYKFFMPKFQKIFDERSQTIQEGLDNAEKAKKQIDSAQQQYDEQLNKARVDAAKIRDDARAQATHIITDARSSAESQAEQITANAQKSIESQKQAALVSLKSDVGVLATALAGKILGTQLEDTKVQSSMIDSMLDDIAAESGASGNSSHTDDTENKE